MNAQNDNHRPVPRTGLRRALTSRTVGRYVTLACVVVLSFVAIHYVTGLEALGLAGTLMTRGVSSLGSAIARLGTGAVQILARGIGLRRLTRTVTTLAGIRLGYAASVVMSDNTVGRARGWRESLKLYVRTLAERWRRLPLWLKIIVVATLVASQVYLHFVLILFPIGFMIPIARRVFVAIADRLIGSWYWRYLGASHRAFVRQLHILPGVRHLVQGRRLLRIRYLRAWRLWRHDPRYRDPVTNRRRKSAVEPIRLWWRRDLDAYIGRPLLSGRATTPAMAAPAERTAANEPEDAGLPPVHSR